MPSTAWLPVGIAGALVVGSVAVLVRRFANPRTLTWPVRGMTLLSWSLGFSIVFLLPLDLASTLYHQCTKASEECVPPTIYVAAGDLRVIWRTLYWVTFALTWAVIPLLQSYTMSGAFTGWGRAGYALRMNVLYLLLMGVGAVGGGVWLVVVKGVGDWGGLQAVVMSVSNAWGLLLIVALMGHGLVSLPRSLWRKADVGGRLRRVAMDAPMLWDEYQEAEDEVREVAEIISRISERVGLANPLRPYVHELLAICPVTLGRGRGANGIASGGLRRGASSPLSLPRSRTQRRNVPEEEVTEEMLTRVNRRIMTATATRDRCRTAWEESLREAWHLQDIEFCRRNEARQFRSSLDGGRVRSERASQMAWWWYVRCRPWSYRLAGAVLGGMSGALLLSEVTMYSSSVWASIYGRMLDAVRSSYGWTEVIACVCILYMCVCAYTSLFRVKVFHLYRLSPHHHTDPASLLFFGGYLCRLTYPLCYNYLNLVEEQDQTVFSQFMGIMDLVPFLGSGFNDWSSFLILVPAVLTAWRVDDRVLKALGLGRYSYAEGGDVEGPGASGSGSEDGSDEEGGRSLGRGWQDRQELEGRALIQREREVQERRLSIEYPSSRAPILERVEEEGVGASEAEGEAPLESFSIGRAGRGFSGAGAGLGETPPGIEGVSLSLFGEGHYASFPAQSPYPSGVGYYSSRDVDGVYGESEDEER